MNFAGALRWLAEHAGLSGVADTTPADASQIVETYDYTDERGTVLSQVVRFAPKTFRQRKPDGNGGWERRVRDVRRVLYRLHELQGKEAVVICEGEKDANRLWDEGIPATTCPGGAGKWRPEDAGQLRDAGITRVDITPHNDPPGRDHAAQVAASCHAAGLKVRIVELPDVPPKGDVSDYLDCHDAGALRQLLRDAEPYVPDTTLPTPAETTGPRLVCMADVEPEAVRWLWPGRIPCGKVTLVIGDPGLGKSTMMLDLAARVSRGDRLPHGADDPISGDVVLLSAEDGLADTLRPRLDAAHADVRRVHCLEAVADTNGDEHFFSLDRDLPDLEQAIRRTGAALVVIDPVSAYLGATDSYKDTEVRQVIAPLAKLAERTGVAIVGVAHLTKRSDAKAIHRAQGNVAFIAAARSAIAVGSDPTDEERRFVVSAKLNLGKKPPALAFRFSEEGRIDWEADPVEGITADQLLNVTVGDGESCDAAAFLREALKDEPVLQANVVKAASANGIAIRTLYRAKAFLGVKSRKRGFEDKWEWCLPTNGSDATESTAKVATEQKVATFAVEPEKRADSTGSAPKVATSACMATLGDGTAANVPPPPAPGARRF